MDEGVFPVICKPHYVLIFGHLMALIRLNEASLRALVLCNLIIAQYRKDITAWSFKFRILELLGFDYSAELGMINKFLSDDPKSYQCWHSWQWLSNHCTEVPKDVPALVRNLANSAKNFHT
jgi:protein farnesyltransferase/geranylgeranyltransferase type-1 subunit alpha